MWKTADIEVSEIEKCVDIGELNAGLKRIQFLVDRIFCEPLNTSQIFGSKRLDELCQRIGRATIDTQENREPPEDRLPKTDLSVYLVSRLQSSGGHTAVLLETIRLSPEARSVVIVSETCGRTNRRAAKVRFAQLPNVSVEYVPGGHHLSKLHYIQRRLAELSPGFVWLFNHHQDSVCIAAVQPHRGYQVRFYHHGDHNLCLGVHLSYAQHIDPHPMGFHNCRQFLGIENNYYMPIVVEDLGNRRADSKFLQNGGLVTCTAAGRNKVEVPYSVQYIDVVPEILRATGGRHIHIGRLTPYARYRIIWGLIKSRISLKNFVYVPYVPSVWRALQDYGVDLYLSSFPYGGGRTLIEVMGAGIPVVVHRHHSSWILGGVDMAYAQAFVWRDITELIDHLKGIDAQRLEQESNHARHRYIQYHRQEILQHALRNRQEIDVPPLRADQKNDELTIALQYCAAVTFRGAASRMIWRCLRRCSASLGRIR